MSCKNIKAEKAEVWQAIKALLIPFSLFLACIAAAAATFLIYNGERIGWFIGSLATLVIVLAFVGLIRFQNTYRANGVLANKGGNDDNTAVVGERADL